MESSVLTSPLLEEARYKARRAKEHAYLLDVELRKFSDTKPYSIVQEYDRNKVSNLFRLKVEREAPFKEWSLIIGDCVHNARSALDYVAWALAGSVVDDDRTMFPIHIFDCDRKFDEAERRWLTNVHPSARKAIRECKLQPYLRPNPQESALWFLHELDRRDKHRLLTPIQQVTYLWHASDSGPFPFIVHALPNSRLEDGAIIAESPGEERPDMQMRLELASDVLFKRGLISTLADYEVRECLTRILDAVDLVIAIFDRLLVLNPDWIPKP
jgi:hypothetical protein